MNVALVKDGMVENVICVSDGVTLVPDPKKVAKRFSLWDGNSFSDNPNAAEMSSFQKKKQQLTAQIMAVSSNDDLMTILKTALSK